MNIIDQLVAAGTTFCKPNHIPNIYLWEKQEYGPDPFWVQHDQFSRRVAHIIAMELIVEEDLYAS